MSFLSFGFPLFLTALIILPVLWWLLRATPPKPVVETFPPFIILKKLAGKEETPHKTPWWLLLLRLMTAALVIIALAQPSWRTKTPLLNGTTPLALIIDNGWAAAGDWPIRLNSAEKLLRQAGEKPVYILATAEAENQDIGPFNTQDAINRLKLIAPRPLPTNRLPVFKRLETAIGQGQIDIAYFSDGLNQPDDKAALQTLFALNRNKTLFYESDIRALVAITGQKNTANALRVSLMRAPGGKAADMTLTAHEQNGLRLAEATAHFDDAQTQTTADITLPLEMRNDVNRISITPTHNAAMSFLIGAENTRKKVGLLSPPTSEMTQPLLSPLYYVTKALQADNEVITVSNHSFSVGIERLIERHPSAIVIGDMAAIPEASITALNHFIEKGGMVIRFAGPNLAASEHDDALLPVKLRRGARSLGGVMSWAAPQKIGAFPENSPLSGLTIPQDVTIEQQILAEPRPDLFEKSWATLADGTPFVTAEQRGNGFLVFIHTAPIPAWSNLPLSGFLETLLNRLIQQAGLVEPDQAKTKTMAAGSSITRAPWRILDAQGQLTMPEADTSPLVSQPGEPAHISIRTPPGLYGSAGQRTALNLMAEDAKIEALHLSEAPGITRLSYNDDSGFNLSGFLLMLAAILFGIDYLLMLLSGGRRGLSFGMNKIAMLLIAAILALPLLFSSMPAYAQMSDQDMVNAAGATHLAYIITGDADIDDTSKSGLETLSLFIRLRTTITPGAVSGLNLEEDELSFYPLIYWPLSANSPVPSQKAIEKINTYMHNGGTVLFDTRDQLSAGLDVENGGSAATKRLRAILSGLDIPPLEAAPADHVVARSYFIMPDFPGRYRGSPLWIEALQQNSAQQNQAARSGDGISAILITANDFAGAWASNGQQGWKYLLVPGTGAQRLWALRGGLNIVMYVLTGNYKADQVHAPEILKRLGQDGEID